MVPQGHSAINRARRVDRDFVARGQESAAVGV